MKWKAGQQRSQYRGEKRKKKAKSYFLMQNPLFKCTKNVTYHLPLHEKRGQANFKTKRNFNYNRKQRILWLLYSGRLDMIKKKKSLDDLSNCQKCSLCQGQQFTLKVQRNQLPIVFPPFGERGRNGTVRAADSSQLIFKVSNRCSQVTEEEIFVT